MSTLGRYEIIDKLGAGSMGTVYRARDTVLDREVALKTIRTGVEVEPELRERFYREARACARLQHPSIVVVHDLGEIDRTAYIAMELLRGFDFRKLIDTRADIPLPNKIEAMAQACEGLAHAHRHGIIHRDIKPSNLFLVDGRTAKVLDFGIARLPSSRLTVAGKILGTPNYMAPEQIMVQPADARADLFSAAVVFFEFLVFEHPFRSDVISRRVVEGEPDSLFDYDSKLPVPLEKIFERALTKDPGLRYQTGDEMAADLRAVLEALNQNASPAFSRVQLPSDREIRTDAPKMALSNVDASLLRPPPPGEDLHEWHLSELMRLIPEFEAAVGRHDFQAANQAFRQLAAIGSVDSRFSDAVQLCHARLDELESESNDAVTEPAQPDSTSRQPVATGEVGTVAGGGQSTTPKTCGYCGASNRRAAVYCIRCGGRLPATLPSQPELPAASPEPNPPPAAIGVAATMIVPERPQKEVEALDSPGVQAPAPEPDPVKNPLRNRAQLVLTQTRRWVEAGSRRVSQWTRRQRWQAGGVAGVVFCFVLAWILLPTLRRVQVQPVAATALVKPDHAVLYKEAKVGSSIATLGRGERVNVLRIPGARDQVWLPVQFVGPKVLRPGYMRISDLCKWDSANPKIKLALIRWSRSGGFASDDEIRTEMQTLKQLVDRFPGTGVAHEAQLEMAGLDLSAARRMKNSGEPATVWRDRLDSARNHLEAAKGEPSVNDGVENMQLELEGLMANSSPSDRHLTPSTIPGATVSGPGSTLPAQSRKASKKKIDDLLKKAQDLLEHRELDQAEGVLGEVEKWEHDNPTAIELRRKIQAERKLEKYQ